ncbi:MAG: hypothetical protein QOE56_2713 [Solirubrobacterales bacterium]|jgi:hypothetical protein|nr:hypothetical protein [Solirubrobacterales bacterium]
MRRPPQSVQLIGSLLVALAIAAIAIAVVTAHFGPTPAGVDDHGGGGGSDSHGRSSDHSGPG